MSKAKRRVQCACAFLLTVEYDEYDEYESAGKAFWCLWISCVIFVDVINTYRPIEFNSMVHSGQPSQNIFNCALLTESISSKTRCYISDAVSKRQP